MQHKTDKAKSSKTMSRRQLFLGWRDAWKEDAVDEAAAQQQANDERKQQLAQLQQARHTAQEGDMNNAVDLYRTFIQQNRNHIDARRELGLCLYELGQHIQARVEFERLARDPEPDPASLLYLGLCLLRLDRPQKALQAWQKYIPLAGEQAPLAELIHTQCELLQQDPPELEQALQTVEIAVSSPAGA